MVREETQQVALPALLCKRLLAFRTRKGDEKIYLIKDPATNQVHEFEPWKYFILESMHEHQDFQKLASVFEDRFGHSITQDELESVIAEISEKKWFGLSAISNPLLMSFKQKIDSRLAGTSSIDKSNAKSGFESKKNGRPNSSANAGEVSGNEHSDSNNRTETKSAAEIAKDLPAGARDAIGYDSTRNKGWKLFDPTGLIKLIQPFLVPFKHAIYLVPLLLVAAIFIYARHYTIFLKDLARLGADVSFIDHVLFGMFTVNLSVTLVTAMVAYSYRATVNAFCIVFIMGFFPRFMVRIGNVGQLSRRERIWLHASPLLFRMGLFGSGMLFWFNTRSMGNYLSPFGLAVTIIAGISFLLTVNPLVKSNGYHLAAAWLDEPQLRKKAYRALLNRLRGNVYQKTDDSVLEAYASAALLFMILIVSIFLFIASRLTTNYMGGAGYLVSAFIGILIIFRVIGKFKKIEQAYERSLQFERWRDRALPKIESEEDAKKSRQTAMVYFRRSILILFLVVLFVPYNYETGGSFIVLPNLKQEITTELSGIVEDIRFNGGEYLTEDTIIGRLSRSEDLSQVKILAAKIKEQEAVIEELKSIPRPEEIRLGKSELETAKTKSQFSEAKLNRLEELYKNKAISFEELDEMRREYAIDIDRIEEKQANLQLTKLGAPPDKIIAAEAKLQSLREERDYYNYKIERSVFHMPFDGKIVTSNLKQKTGSYLAKGEVLAVVENTEQAVVQIQVPEQVIGFVEKSAKVRFRPFAFHAENIAGVVSSIDAVVTDEPTGKVVKVNALIENKNGRLKSGMTGYAKIQSGTMPLWKVASLAVVRFLRVEVWSWLP